jgi:glyoxylase-like metal-dependent hydrolase (beta-lactamase superfamily II)/uncharacterized membrane protein YedE/YeeE
MKNFIGGGLLIGLGAVTLLMTTGYISGMNSMLDTIFIKTDDFQYRWKTLWLSVFLLFGIILSNQSKNVESLPLNVFTFISFFILAFGVRMAQGCTSGHGINGLARLSKRSFVAVAVFFGCAVLTSTFFTTLKIHKTESMNNNILIPIIFVMTWIIYAFKKTVPKDENSTINLFNIIAVTISASLFAGGLVLSKMYQFSVVKDFLNLKSKNWNFGLMIVFGSAVLVSLMGYQLVGKMNQPLTLTCEQTYIKDEECKFMFPKRNQINTKLIVGSSLFGVGWGLTGMCPSTFPIRLGLGDPSAYLALLALYLGYKSEDLFENIVQVKSLNDNIILHQFFDKPSSSFTYIVGDKKTNEVVIIDSVYNSTNYEIPTMKLMNNFYFIDKNIPTSVALLKFCDSMNYKIKYLMNTHIHVDHITANTEIKKLREIPSIIGDYENTKSDMKYKENEPIVVNNNFIIESFKTPGHTKNCYSLMYKSENEQFLFCGDALLITGIGRTDLDSKETEEDYDKNKEILFDSLCKIINKTKDFKNETHIYPAHDYTERRTITYSEIFNINPYMKYAQEYLNGNENSKILFLKQFKEKEKSLAHFDDYDINLCVDINKMCGLVDNIDPDKLDQLWSKESGACG